MVPQSGRKEFQSDNRFWMNPALPDSLYHSAAQPDSMLAFSGGAIENAYAFSHHCYYTIAPPSRHLCEPFPAAQSKMPVGIFPDGIIP